MTKRVLIIGGYGNFGSFITKTLAREDNLQVIIAGRSQEKADKLAREVGAEAVTLDINSGLTDALAAIKPDIVIHTSGPFQAQGYKVAIHLSLWALSWLVRIGLIRKLERAAPFLLKTSYLFDWLGTDNSGFHMELSGTGKDGEDKTIKFELTARSGDGPYIPCMPTILMARKLAGGDVKDTGAAPCMGFITLDEYLGALGDMDISWTVM